MTFASGLNTAITRTFRSPLILTGLSERGLVAVLQRRRLRGADADPERTFIMSQQAAQTLNDAAVTSRHCCIASHS
jgi:hypothetical protein